MNTTAYAAYCLQTWFIFIVSCEDFIVHDFGQIHVCVSVRVLGQRYTLVGHYTDTAKMFSDAVALIYALHL